MDLKESKYMKLRKEQEREFHNRLRRGISEQRWSPKIEEIIKSDSLWSNMKYYSIERKSRLLVFDWLAQRCNGRRILDYCCGNGEDSIIAAKIGAKEVIGIDISEVSIENCKERAIREGVGKNTSFYVMDAEALEFDDNYFDIIIEYGSLHHLNLQKAYRELARVLKPDGEIICTEALRHNPVIHLYRKITPHLRTPWEVDHILGKSELKMAKKYFGKVEASFFHLATLCAVPFRNMTFFPRLLKILEDVDSILLSIPFVKWQAWQVVFVLAQPNKSLFR